VTSFDSMLRIERPVIHRTLDAIVGAIRLKAKKEVVNQITELIVVYHGCNSRGETQSRSWVGVLLKGPAHKNE
jgi:hypothetical protein